MGEHSSKVFQREEGTDAQGAAGSQANGLRAMVMGPREQLRRELNVVLNRWLDESDLGPTAVLEVISTVINDFCDAPDVEFEADFPIEEDDDGN